jgi:hypothetical protein
MAKVRVFPFPPRNPAYTHVHEILFDGGLSHTAPEYRLMYERSQGTEARLVRFQYLGIEEELERSLRYVSPSDDNADVYSLKFAEIIRSAANTYEIVGRALYVKFYNDTDEINIFHLLGLEHYLELSDQTVSHYAALGQFPNHPEVCRPFVRLLGWDRKCPTQAMHIPYWWTAYNKVKHSNEGLKEHATLANAMAVTAAVFLLIERVYGFGVLQGGQYILPSDGNNIASAGGETFLIRNHPTWSRLFIRI